MVPERLLEFAAECYEFDRVTLYFISDTSNSVYGFRKSDRDYILRFSQRPFEYSYQTQAEMDWLHYLAAHDVSVSPPLVTRESRLVASAEEGGDHYVISAFEKVGGAGCNTKDPQVWNAKLFRTWGRAMGDMHRLSKGYIPRSSRERRSAFTGREALGEGVKAYPTVNSIVQALVGEILSLPKDRDSYGLIHYDFHPYNFAVDGDRINVFDFDDSLYGWFAMDIGIALYHALWWGLPDDERERNAFVPVIVRNFLEGYLTDNRLDECWLGRIPLFMRFRQICAFSWFLGADTASASLAAEMHNIESGILFARCQVDNSLFAGYPESRARGA